MREESLIALCDLYDSPDHMAAVKELLAEETRTRMEELRNLVRGNQVSGAQAAEGAITALEELPGVIARHVAMYRAGRVRI